MVEAHHGHVVTGEKSGQKDGNGFAWRREGSSVILICPQYQKPPLSVQIVLDEPWQSETVLVPRPFVASLAAPGASQQHATNVCESDYYGPDEEPTEVYSWMMVPDRRNMAHVKYAETKNHDRDRVFEIEVRVLALPDVKTREAFDSARPSEISAGFYYIVQFTKERIQ